MLQSLISHFHFARRVSATLNVKQIVMSKQSEDQQFKNLLKQDLNTSLKTLDRDVPEAKRGDSRLPIQKEDLNKQDTFTEMYDRFDRVCKSLKVVDGGERALLYQMTKEDFFERKKLSEEQARLDEQRKFKDRHKELRKVYKQFGNIGLEEDPQNAETIPHFNNLGADAQYDQLQYLINKYQDKRRIDPYLLQRARTTANMESFIYAQMLDSQKDLMKLGVKDAIKISEVLTNQSCTVVWVRWNYTIPGSATNKEIKLLNAKLNKYAKYLSGQMCQKLGLKFGPDIRFELSHVDEQLANIKKDINENAELIVNSELIERFQAGSIPSKISKQDYNELVQQVKDKQLQLDSMNQLTEIKKDSKKQTSENKVIKQRANKSSIGASKADKFWDSL